MDLNAAGPDQASDDEIAAVLAALDIVVNESGEKRSQPLSNWVRSARWDAIHVAEGLGRARLLLGRRRV